MSSPETQWQTYWCHECDMSIHLLISTNTTANGDTLFCPHCHLDFLELMDAPPLTTSSTAGGPTALFLLDSPSFRSLCKLNTCDNSSDSNPTIKITPSMLESDPTLLCVVCTEQFVIDAEATQLPCNHFFHPDCILPWLSSHTTCPLCRFHVSTTETRPLQIEEENWEWESWSYGDP